ncbi:MAG: hypothetical protein DPW16_07095 [Chloroflexi bacterium]|nr:hypothetical protein [Chloroflexota bacterium]
MVQDDLPAILLTRVQQVYAILASVADTPNTIATDREGHSKEGMVSASEYASELNDDISACHDTMVIEKEQIGSRVEQSGTKE